MANLWRTERPRFPLYQSDGLGRDYYIKYTNGGYWENQFVLTKKPDYERPRYNNFHSLYHMAAPFKYWGNGSGRENYILKCNGFHHDQKPLCSYQLTDFLRNNLNSKGIPENYRRKIYFSVSEARYNQKLKNLEKQLVKRLYTEPMKQRRKKKEMMAEEENKEINNNKIAKYAKTFSNFSRNKENNYDRYNTELNGNNIIKQTIKIKNNISLDANNWRNKYKNKMSLNNFHTVENKKYDNTLFRNYDQKKKMGLETISPQNNIRILDSETGNHKNRNLKYKSPNINEKILLKKIKIVTK